MKRLLNMTVVVTVLVYLISSFVVWDLNPANWEGDVRLNFVATWVFFMFYGVLIIMIASDYREV